MKLPWLISIALAGAAWGQSASPVFTSNVREVSVVFRVVDKNGRPIPGITAKEIHIDDGGVPRPITSFQGGVGNAQAVILADVSGSMGTVLEPLEGALFTFADIVSGDYNHQPGDVQLSLIPFSNTARVLIDRTSDPAEFKDAVARLRPSGTTALVDSVLATLDSAFGEKEVSRIPSIRRRGISPEQATGPIAEPTRPAASAGGEKRSKFLVIFTDAGENASAHRWSDIASAMLGKEVAMYSVVFDSGSPDSDFSTLSKITLQSGGKVFRAGPNDLERIYSEIARDIRSHYQLTFAAADVPNPRSWRNLRIATDRPGATIFARAGYCPEAPCQKPDGTFVGGHPKNWNEVLAISRDPAVVYRVKQHLSALKFETTPETAKAVANLAASPMLIEKTWNKRGAFALTALKTEGASRQVSIDAEVCGIALDSAAPPSENPSQSALIVADPEIRIARRQGDSDAYFQSQAIFYLEGAGLQQRIRVQCNRPNFLIGDGLVEFASHAVSQALRLKIIAQ
ncbi:MAG: VWA domain-containing protein [Bryobacteraceae bacterium]